MAHGGTATLPWLVARSYLERATSLPNAVPRVGRGVGTGEQGAWQDPAELSDLLMVVKTRV